MTNAGPLVLKAKLLAPPIPAGYVPRVRLRQRLEPTRPLTLVTAPAGFGKTSAVIEWLSQSLAPVGWLSLDEGDNDVARLFAHLVAALQHACPGTCDELVKAAAEASDKDVPVLLAAVTNELHAVQNPFYLVLDDYHVVESPAVHQAVGFVVEHMPPAMRLVVTTRREPPLPLPRWRMRGRLTELTDRDLRFTAEEASAFLNDTMGLRLEPTQIGLLEKKTEGWIGGLQLAALSLVERANRDDFLTEFAGDDRYVMDYLTAEVLAGQPPAVQRFLLRTSVLERMNASSCEAVSGQDGCAEILERLERERVFVVALDGNRQWYRYHHLFADLLRHQLASSETERASDCHRAASAWYESEGDLAEAARHARLTGDPECLASIMQTHGLDLATRGRSKQALVWVRELPEGVVVANPRRLQVAMWCEYLRTGRLPATLRARAAESAAREPEGGLIDETLAVFDAFEAARDPSRYAQALELASAIAPRPGQPALVRLGVDAIAASCAHALDDLDTADARYTRLASDTLAAHAVTLFAFTSYGQGRLRLTQRGPAAARRHFAHARSVATDLGWDGLPVAMSLRIGEAETDLEAGDATAAETRYEEALSLAEHEPTTVRHPVYLALAELYHADGRHDECEAMLRRIDAEAHIVSLLPVGGDIRVARAWLDLARGHLDRVQTFLDAHRRDPTSDELTGLRGPRDDARRLLGRYALLRHEYARAIAELTDVLDDAVRGGRIDTVIRCRIDLAVARAAQGQRREAFAQLDAAVDSALGLDAADRQPRGYHRVFAAAAPPDLAALLRQRLDAGGLGGAARAFLEGLVARAPQPSRAQPRIEEPLSPSERRVLEQLVAGRANKEIAQRLFVSPNTVKTHIRRIYGKLGAKNRAEAIVRAQALGLTPA